MYKILSGIFFGFLTFIDLEILSVSIFWISFLFRVDLVLIIFSTNANKGDVLSTAFLEKMNALLASGEVPGLFEEDEYLALIS